MNSLPDHRDDYDALAAELAEVKEDRYAVTRQRNEALHRLDEYIALDASMGATILELRARVRELEAANRLYQYPPEHRVSVAEARIAQLEAAMVEVRAKLAIYLERLMRGDGVLPNRWVGEINDIVHRELNSRQTKPEG